ncbi:MAG: hypothetical protein GY855_05895 [candidate division Zixibacteria bacterium]|nr:hypothetical protein [candidate division Zixibacteria bacterium]
MLNQIMSYVDINKRAYIRDAADLLSDGKADEAVALIEQNGVSGQMTVLERLINALSHDAIGQKYKARQELMNILTIDPSYPAAIEQMMEFCDKDHKSLGDYYKNRLNEIMSFVEQAEEFWICPDPEDLTDESVEQKPELKESIDKESLIKSINDMLGSEAERVWPFETKTLAELFIKQGHLRRGLAVYGRLLNDTDDDMAIVNRVNELISTSSAKSGHKLDPVNSDEESENKGKE